MSETTETRNDNTPAPAAAAATDTDKQEPSQSLARRWSGTLRATAAAMLPSRRTAKLAGGAGLAAGAGVLAGTLFAFGLGPAAAPASSAVADDVRALKQAVTQLEQQLGAVRAGIEAANRATGAQHTRLTERHEQAARAQAEMQTRLARIADTLERLDKRVVGAVAAETAGSAAQRGTAPAGNSGEAQAPAAEKAPPKAQYVEGWVVRDVYRGRALVQSRRGLYEVAAGSTLPELGRVESVARQDGRWVVVTARGLIAEQPRARQTY